MARVPTACAASKTVDPSAAPSWMASLRLAPERVEMDGTMAAVIEQVGLMLRSMTEAAELRVASLRSARMAGFLMQALR